VVTRHVDSSSDRGISFTARLDDSSISLTWAACPVGTEIKIAIPAGRRSRVSSTFGIARFFEGWKKEIAFHDGLGQYFSAHPSVRRVITAPGRADIILPLVGMLPTEGSPISFLGKILILQSIHKFFGLTIRRPVCLATG
jgi:hypothetical protein